MITFSINWRYVDVLFIYSSLDLFFNLVIWTNLDILFYFTGK